MQQKFNLLRSICIRELCGNERITDRIVRGISFYFFCKLVKKTFCNGDSFLRHINRCI